MLKKTAVVLGATGLVGDHCLRLLLASDYYHVIALTRRSLPLAHSRLENVVIDFEALDDINIDSVHDVFCCLGTTIKKAGSRHAFEKVDLEYVAKAAKVLKSKGARHFLLVSALGANSRSIFFYNQVKGAAEHAVLSGYEYVSIFRPSLLLGDRKEFRAAEFIGQCASKVMMPLMIGPIAKSKPVHALQVAKAMIKQASSVYDQTRQTNNVVVESTEIGAMPLDK